MKFGDKMRLYRQTDHETGSHRAMDHVLNENVSQAAAIAYTALFTCVTLLFPIVASKYPALIDFPAHLARHYIGATINSSPDLQQFYSYSWWPVPNMAADLLFIPLNMVLSPLNSERIIIGSIILLWVFAPLVLHRAIWGYWSVAPLLAALVVFNTALLGGLENFLIASPLSILGFALWIHWRKQLTIGRIISIGLFATAVYFGHALAWIVLGLLIASYELQMSITGREALSSRLSRLCIAAVSFLPGFVFAVCIGVTARTTGKFETLFGGIESRIHVVLSPFLMYHKFPDLLALAFLFGLIVWRLLSTRRAAVHRSMLATIGVLSFVCAFTPAIVQDVRGMHVRLPPVFVGILIASMCWRDITVRQWRVIGAIFICVMLARSVSVSTFWRQHQAEVIELRKSFMMLDRGATLLSVTHGNTASIGLHTLSANYAILDRHIFSPSIYPDAHMLHITLPYKRLSRLVAHPVDVSKLPLPGSQFNTQFESDAYWQTWWRDFSYLLVLTVEPLDPQFKDHVQLVSKGSFFRLYRVLR